MKVPIAALEMADDDFSRARLPLKIGQLRLADTSGTLLDCKLEIRLPIVIEEASCDDALKPWSYPQPGMPMLPAEGLVSQGRRPQVNSSLTIFGGSTRFSFHFAL